MKPVNRKLLSPVRIEALLVLRRYGSSVSHHEVRAAMGWKTPGTASACLYGLKAAGYVDQTPVSRLWFLTQAGRRDLDLMGAK